MRLSLLVPLAAVLALGLGFGLPARSPAGGAALPATVAALEPTATTSRSVLR